MFIKKFPLSVFEHYVPINVNGKIPCTLSCLLTIRCMSTHYNACWVKTLKHLEKTHTAIYVIRYRRLVNIKKKCQKYWQSSYIIRALQHACKDPKNWRNVNKSSSVIPTGAVSRSICVKCITSSCYHPGERVCNLSRRGLQACAHIICMYCADKDSHCTEAQMSVVLSSFQPVSVQ